MRGCLSLFARILAVGLAIVFIVSLPLSLVAFNLGRIAFSPERMTRLVTDTIAETGGLRRMVMETLSAPDGSSEGEGLNLGQALGYLTPQERDALGEKLTPPQWGEEQLGSLVAALYVWIDDDRARPVFIVDIAPLKAGLLSGGAEAMIDTVVDSWPSCTVAQVAEMSLEALMGGGPITFCEPPEPLRSGLIGMLNVSMATSLRALPDQVALSGAGANAPASPELMATKERIRQVRALAGWSWLLSPAMLGLIMALAIRSWRGVALWWGIPILIGAVLTLGTTAAARVLLEKGIRGLLVEAAMPVWIGDAIRAMATAMLSVAFRRVALQSAGLALLGLALLAGGLLLSRRGGPRPVAAVRAETLAVSPPAGAEEEPPLDDTPPSGMFG